MRATLAASVFCSLLATAAACGGASKGRDGTTPGDGNSSSNGSAAVGGERGGSTSDADGVGRSQKKSGPKAPTKKVNAAALANYNEGARAAKEGDAKRAKAAFDSAIEADSSAFPALYGLGVLADRRGEPDRALSFYRRALQIQPDYAPAVAGLSAIYARRGSERQAVAFAAPIANRWSGNLPLQIVYAETLIRAKDYDKAWNVIRRTIRQDERYLPAFVTAAKLARAQNRKELTASIVEQAFKISDKSADLHLLKGMLAEEEGDVQTAVDAYGKAVTLQPDLVEARVALGKKLLDGGNYAAALRHFKAATGLAPSLAGLQLLLGEAYRSMKQWAKAKSAYDLVLRMQPNMPEVHFNMGLMYMAAGADFPDLDKLAALEAARKEFTAYRNAVGPRRLREDPTEEYLRDLGRQISREKRRQKLKEQQQAQEQSGEGEEG